MLTSDPSFEPVSVRLTINAQDGASELLLLNGAYNQVGQAVGSLSAEVAPGAYHVRQRIGDTESIEEIRILSDSGPQTLTLKALDFPSPAPIVGTSTFPKVNPEDWKKPLALVGKPGIRIVVRSPGDTFVDAPTVAALSHLRAETARLRIETISGELVCDFNDCTMTTGLGESALFIRDVEAQPGHYVLTQSIDSERQLCLPLIVHHEWSPRVYLLSLRDQEASAPDSYLPVSLDNASIIYWPSNSPESPAQPDLIRLEAARKALARGRSLGGFAGTGEENVVGREPMLSLFDAYLLLKDMRPSEAHQADAAICAAADALGEAFPDVVALRYGYWEAVRAIRKSQGEPGPELEPPRAPEFLSGPPLLAPSWRHLLNWPLVCDRLSAFMPPDFIPEVSPTWFIWSEKKGGRGSRSAANSDLQGSAPEARIEFGSSLALLTAQKALVALLETGAVQGFVGRVVKSARYRIGETDPEKLDPVLKQLIDALLVIQSPLLKAAFGNEELARRVLTSLNLPNDRLYDLLEMLKSTIAKEGLVHGELLAEIAQVVRIFGAFVKKKLRLGEQPRDG